MSLPMSCQFPGTADELRIPRSAAGVRMAEFRAAPTPVCCDRGMIASAPRPAVPADIPAVLEFWRTAAEGVSVTDDEDGVARLIRRDPEALILAERDGEIVGTVIAGFDGWRCHLYRLAVHPAHRRQGLARALLAAAEERFVRLGGRRADAMVLVRNATAQLAWSAAGYGPEEAWRRWVKPLADGTGA